MRKQTYTSIVGAAILVLLVGLVSRSNAPVIAQDHTPILAGSLSASTAAVAINADGQSVIEVVVQNDPDNAVSIFIGNEHTQSIELTVGSSITLPVQNLLYVFVRADSGTPTVNWLARGR